jgi:hypothetical protein
MRPPLEDTMLLKGAAFSINCSATNVVDFAAAIMLATSPFACKPFAAQSAVAAAIGEALAISGRNREAAGTERLNGLLSVESGA